MMRRPNTLLNALVLLCLNSAYGQNMLQKTSCPSAGPCFDRDTFRKNLQYITRSVLPEGWKLNAVVKVSPAKPISRTQRNESWNGLYASTSMIELRMMDAGHMPG
jgi:hypothetical protein